RSLFSVWDVRVDPFSFLRLKLRALSPEGRRRALAAALVAGFAATCATGLSIVRYPDGAPASWLGSSFLICAMVMLRGRPRVFAVAACAAIAFVAARLETPWALVSNVLFAVFTVAE